MPMFTKLLRLLGRKPALILGTGKLPEGQSKSVQLGDPLAGDTEIVLARVGGRLCAIDSRCPHEPAGRITDGPLLEGRYLVCPLHNYLFDPTNGRAVGGSCGKAKRYRVREENGDAEIDI
jgi:nitrite reductase/ring-hydroxylating ferredoxin subunit